MREGALVIMKKALRHQVVVAPRSPIEHSGPLRKNLNIAQQPKARAGFAFGRRTAFGF